MSEVSIYTLSDPDTKIVHYVGQTVNPAKRLIQHIESSKKSRRKSSLWISGLVQAGKRPHMNVIDTCAKDEADSVEAQWIVFYMILNPSLNKNDHGFPVMLVSRPSIVAEMKKIPSLFSMRGYTKCDTCGKSTAINDSFVFCDQCQKLLPSVQQSHF
jgi:Zn finger protein HypA/HybF involved in hydrogenase expression